MGDAAAISLTGVGEGSDHTFSSQGIPPVGVSFPRALITHHINYRQSLTNKYLQGDCYGCTVTGHCESI